VKFLSRHQDLLYAALRIAAGFLFLQHGLQKCFGLLGGQVATAPLMVAAGWIELVAGALIAIGLLTPYAAFLASGQMAVAYFYAHAPNGFWPVVNRGELAALYCFVFLFIAARGSGMLSIDRLRGKK
jgi:putative oxidoreductase